MHSLSGSNTLRCGVSLSPWAAAALLTAGCGGGGDTNVAPGAGSGATSPTPGPRPNFVFVLVDDLDVSSAELMPRINALLVQRGVSFTNSFACNPVSAPSRATLLTGLHSHNHGVRNNTNAYQVFLANQGSSNLAPWLRNAGYRTAMIGKLMNKYVGEGPLPGWDEWQAVYSDEGSGAYFNYSIRETDGSVTTYREEEEDYVSDVLTDRALAFLERAVADDSRPFFLWLGYNAPHEPAVAASRHVHQFANARAPRTPSFNEENMNDKPSHYQDIPLMDDDRIYDLDRSYRERLRCMLSVDEAVERIVALLQTSGRLANTFIIFMSDNGYLQGQHRYFWGKDVPYELSIRVPLTFRGPRVPEGRKIEQLVTNVDFAPTIAALAGITPPGESDGRSLAPFLTGAAPESWRTSILIEHVAPFVGQLVTYSGLRTADHKFVRYITAEVELYDLRGDPDETENLRLHVERSVLGEWEARLAAVAECRGAACP
ncbi:MAG: sulfatase [Vicinamibacteria bacterium]|nr:sulfatase [Vicinamibacteria bacterium]